MVTTKKRRSIVGSRKEKVEKSITEKASTLIASLPDKPKEEVLALSVRNIDATALAELEAYEFDGINTDTGEPLPEDTNALLRQRAIELQTQLRSSLLAIVEVGRILNDVKERLPHGSFMKWVAAAAPELHIDTIGNYMNSAKLYERYRPEELAKMTLSALYTLGRKNIEASLQDIIVREIAPTVQEKLTNRDMKRIIRGFRQMQIAAVDLDEKAKPFLLQSSVAEDKDELQRLSRLSKKNQIKVAEVLAENPQLTKVKEALEVINPAESPTTFEVMEAEIVSVKNNLETRKGLWTNLLAKTPSESVDLCFAEMPLSREALDDYPILADQMSRILKPGGMLLAVVSQQNIQFVGPKLDPLHVAWTFMILRRPGNSPRVIGRVSFASSYVPLSLTYKPPLRAIPGLVDDLRSGSPDPENIAELAQDAMNLHHSFLGEDNPRQAVEERFQMVSIETSLDYYLTSLLRPTDTFMHLIHTKKHSFGVNDHLYETAFKAQVSKVISLIGN